MADHPNPQPRPTVAAFLASLPTLTPSSLPENSQTCLICQEPFSSNPPNSEGGESPLQLPCTHIMGSGCLARWFAHNGSCPMCRAVFLPNAPPSPAHAELDALLLTLSFFSEASARHGARLVALEAGPATEGRRREIEAVRGLLRGIEGHLDGVAERVGRIRAERGIPRSVREGGAGLE